DQSIGVMEGIRELAEQRGMKTRDFLEQANLIIHGTTTADNTMIEQTGAKTGLLVTKGRRDEIELRRGYKENIWDPSAPGPFKITPRRYRLTLEERLHYQGNVLKDNGFKHPLLVMQSSGGIAAAPSVAARPIATLASGPAGGVMGACETAGLAGVKDFISVDMGGTSYDVCLIRDGQPTIKSFW